MFSNEKKKGFFSLFSNISIKTVQGIERSFIWLGFGCCNLEMSFIMMRDKNKRQVCRGERRSLCKLFCQLGRNLSRNFAVVLMIFFGELKGRGIGGYLPQLRIFQDSCWYNNGQKNRFIREQEMYNWQKSPCSDPAGATEPFRELEFKTSGVVQQFVCQKL